MITPRKEFMVVVLLGFTVCAGWSLYDSSLLNGLLQVAEVSAATQSVTSTLDVTVGANITVTIDGTCDNGHTNCDANASASFATLSALTSANANTRIKSVSNKTVSLAVGRRRAITSVTLASNASPASINISDLGSGVSTTNAGPRVFTGCGSPVTSAWNEGASTGLGFSVWAADSNKSTSCWGTGSTQSDSSNKYAALQASSAASTAWTSSSIGTQYASVGYRIAVIATQQATTYTGGVIYTGTTTP